MTPYKVQLIQELKPIDHPMHFRFAKQTCDRQKMPILAKKIIFSAEAHFDLGWYVNKQNCCIWGTENPRAYFEKPTHPNRVTVWCGFWFRALIGSFFFENQQGEAVTVNGDRYRAMLNEFLFTKIEEEDIGNIWFLQEGAPTPESALDPEAIFDILRPVFEDSFRNYFPLLTFK